MLRRESRKVAGVGTETVDPLEFLARLVTHIPNKHQVMTRYYGWYANRPRGTRRKATTDADVAPITVAEPEALPLREARRRWAEGRTILRQAVAVILQDAPHERICQCVPVYLPGNFMKEMIDHVDLRSDRIYGDAQIAFLAGHAAYLRAQGVAVLRLASDGELYGCTAVADKIADDWNQRAAE